MARRVERAERSHCCGADSPVQLASSIFYLSSFFLSLFLPPSPSYLLSSVLSLSVYIYIFFFFFFLLPYTHNLVPDDDGMERGGREKERRWEAALPDGAHRDAERTAAAETDDTTTRRGISDAVGFLTTCAVFPSWRLDYHEIVRETWAKRKNGSKLSSKIEKRIRPEHVQETGANHSRCRHLDIEFVNVVILGPANRRRSSIISFYPLRR